MLKIVRLFLLLIVFISCSQTSNWDGVWDAKWETDPEGYPGTTGITDFTMAGQITFDGDSITIEGYGFEGCIFSADTIRHSMTWTLSKDSLFLFNSDHTPGMIYILNDQKKNYIRLQLIEDIYLTLTK